MSKKTQYSYIIELAKGAELTLKNAEELYREGEILFACKALSRSLFLHQISLEECGKIEILGWWATGYLMGQTIDLRKMKSNIVNHRAKNFANAYMLPHCEAEKKAKQENDWHKSILAFKKQQAEFHQESNERKNASLYVDYSNNIFISPRDCITDEMVREIANRNQEFIELMRPKVQMLTHWAQNADSARKTLRQFKKRIIELLKIYPKEPQRALDTLLQEMLTIAM